METLFKDLGSEDVFRGTFVSALKFMSEYRGFVYGIFGFLSFGVRIINGS